TAKANKAKKEGEKHRFLHPYSPLCAFVVKILQYFSSFQCLESKRRCPAPCAPWQQKKYGVYYVWRTDFT
ncbi:MAG: hypothetical protein LBS57_13880, partial [Treponema sp.]|nr:hypothetical protein [Treponema sp.]